MAQKKEGEFRAIHSELINHCEEIAFYEGSNFETIKLSRSLENLLDHHKYVLEKKFLMGIYDSMLVKYGAVITGYFIHALPVFGRRSSSYLETVNADPSQITKDYMRNASLLLNLSKAIGRIITSYKDIQNLAGYTHLVYQIKTVIHELENGKYQRQQISDSFFGTRGKISTEADRITFDKVPIVSPNGDVLIKQINLDLNYGMHLFIQGPNGCGKSSLFRVLGGLWPLFGGALCKPSEGDIFYIPQKAYLPPGTLREQLIYPDVKSKQQAKGIRDMDLLELLEIVGIHYIVDREGGWDAVNDWADVLSGGEKQRMAMARLLYHKPKFAVLDECTSAVSIEIEGKLYEHFKKVGITLITVSHRDILMKHHDYLLKFDGEGFCEFHKLKTV